MLTLNNDFMIVKTILLKDVTNNIYFNSFVEGIDDLRIINEQYFICSHGNFNNNRLIHQCLGTYDINTGNVNSLVVLKGPNIHKHEKNWLPLIIDDDIYVIYTTDPFILYKVNKETGDLLLIKNNLKLTKIRFINN
jgi:hypothetical protein